MFASKCKPARQIVHKARQLPTADAQRLFSLFLFSQIGTGQHHAQTPSLVITHNIGRYPQVDGPTILHRDVDIAVPPAVFTQPTHGLSQNRTILNKWQKICAHEVRGIIQS